MKKYLLTQKNCKIKFPNFYFLKTNYFAILKKNVWTFLYISFLNSNHIVLLLMLNFNCFVIFDFSSDFNFIVTSKWRFELITKIISDQIFYKKGFFNAKKLQNIFPHFWFLFKKIEHLYKFISNSNHIVLSLTLTLNFNCLLQFYLNYL